MTKDSEQVEKPEQEPDYVQHLSDEFDTLCQLRHETGAEEYGDVAFLTAPLIRMAAEELADMTNYCRYMYVRLRMMEEHLMAAGIDLSDTDSADTPLGPIGFIPGEKVSGFISRKEQDGHP